MADAVRRHLTAAVTATAGPISFIALAAPQIARRPPDNSVTLTSSALMGATLLLGADVVSQHLLRRSNCRSGS